MAQFTPIEPVKSTHTHAYYSVVAPSIATEQSKKIQGKNNYISRYARITN